MEKNMKKWMFFLSFMMFFSITYIFAKETPRKDFLGVVKDVIRVNSKEVDQFLQDVVPEDTGKEVNTKIIEKTFSTFYEGDEYTALMLFTVMGNTHSMEKLIKAGADVNHADPNGWTALMYACAQQKSSKDFDNKKLLSVVKTLLKANNIDLNLANKPEHKRERQGVLAGFTALMIAAENGHADVVKELLEKGANVNLENKQGFTALILAAQEGHTGVVTELLTKGADVNKTNKRKMTALMLAAFEGHTGTVTKLLEKGADVHLSDTDGFTALILAASNGVAAVVSALLEKGADVNLSDTNGTALMYAAREGHKDVVTELLAKGADVDKATKEGLTALMAAAENGHTAVVTKLLGAKGINVNKTTTDGWTALMAAAENGHKAIVEVLLNLRRKREGVFYRAQEYRTEKINTDANAPEVDPCSIDIKGYRDHIQKHGGSQGILKLLQEARKKCTETGAPK